MMWKTELLVCWPGCKTRSGDPVLHQCLYKHDLCGRDSRINPDLPPHHKIKQKTSMTHSGRCGPELLKSFGLRSISDCMKGKLRGDDSFNGTMILNTAQLKCSWVILRTAGCDGGALTAGEDQSCSWCWSRSSGLPLVVAIQATAYFTLYKFYHPTFVFK